MAYRKWKLLTVSDLGVATGFSRVMGSIIENLPSRWDIHSLAINYFGDPHNVKAKLYPASLGGDLYGVGRLPKLIEAIKPDTIFMLQDSWILQHLLATIPEEYLEKTVLYVPVDAGPYQHEWLKLFPKVRQVCAYTEFGKTVLSEANPEIKDIQVIPHGIDTTKFFPLDQDKCREEIGELDPDWYIVLNVNRNQPRKRLDIASKAFGVFARDKDNVRYYHHAGVEDAGWDIRKLAYRYGWSKKLILTSKDISPTNFVSDETLNKIYNVADIGINTSEGEGWGLCFAKGTDVLTSKGFKKIENVCIGDYVYDDAGKLTRVTNFLSRPAPSNMYEVKLSGLNPSIVVSGEHPLLTKDGYVKAENLFPEDYIFKSDIEQANNYSTIDLSHYFPFPTSNNSIYLRTSKLGDKVSRKELAEAKNLYHSNLSRNQVRKINRYIPLNENLVTILSYFLTKIPQVSQFMTETPELSDAIFDFFNYKKSPKQVNLRIGPDLIEALRRIAFTQSVYTTLDRDLLELLFYDLMDKISYRHPNNLRVLLAAKNKTKQRILRIILLRLSIAFSEFSIKDGTIYFSLDKKYLRNRPKTVKTGINRVETINGYYYKVLSVTPSNYCGEVYNLETDSHTYNVYGYAVHNCNMEHAVTGKPQIIPANSANMEVYADDTGLLVPVSVYNTNPRILTEGAAVSVSNTVKALEYAYSHQEEMKELGLRARERFLDEKYSWKNIAEKFRRYLRP